MKVTIDVQSSPKVLTKGNGRIFVTKKEHIKIVDKVLKETQEYEHSYLPEHFIAVYDPNGNNALTYTHKFDPDIEKLIADCQEVEVEILVYSCNEYHYNHFLLLEKRLATIVNS